MTNRRPGVSAGLLALAAALTPLEALSAREIVCVLVAGCTDASGNAECNQQPSERRVVASIVVNRVVPGR